VIRRLLVANRGEIAVRVLRTARRLGIATVAVYSDADVRARHVLDADTAVRIGPAPATHSYLNPVAILDAARQSGADAIHPGYGFLSENPDFAEAVVDAGLTWVGPPASAMRALGDKAHAKALAERHGVPVLPGYHDDDQALDVLREHAARIGYPVLVKASAGGGGRGMRVVDSPAEFDDHVEAARREAQAAFGDARVLLERYVRRPRHVEIQIIGDAAGHFVHLGERECSIQRRHQKLIEESPSPGVDAPLRERMGEAALRLARAAGYSNAGTVEFLLLPGGEFAFLEVNARLQVEHPATELVTGLDLVELQLRVASGDTLPLRQSDVALDAHAIEVRVVAEDPLAGWVPSSGPIERCVFPPPETVRVDTWIGDGTVVSPYYDSLLAKIVARGPTRPEAIVRLAAALGQTWIDGVSDNLDVLLATLDHPAFRAGELHTGFLDEHHILERTAELPLPVLAAASVAPLPEAADPWRSASNWRLARVDQPSAWQRAGRVHTARVSLETVEADGVSLRAEVLGPDRVAVGDRVVNVARDRDRMVVELDGQHYRLRRAPPPSLERANRSHGAAGDLTAPMPARVVKINVTPGDAVSQNQPLVVLEAMKMEHVVEAPHAGVVGEVRVELGEQVPAGAPLVVLRDN
jgi:3-methylcrotonyl-CoA carboxylase alpha subunit